MLTLIVLFISASIIFSQSDEIVYVTCLAEYESLASDRSIPTDEYGCFSEFIFPVEAELNANGYKLIKQDDYSLPTDLHVVAEIEARGRVLYFLMPANNNHLSPSSLLYRHVNNFTYLYLNNTFYFGLGDHGFNIDREIIDLALGLLFYDSDKCDLATPFFESVAEQIDSQSDSPRSIDLSIQFYKGNCAILDNNIEQAIIEYESGINLNDFQWGEVGLTTNLAWAYIQIGNEERAFELFDQLEKEIYSYDYPLSKALIIYFQSRARLYALTFDYTSAIADIDFAINEAKSYGLDIKSMSRLFKQRGDIIMLIYEWNRALEDYNTAIELAPDYAEAYYRRGILLYTMVERENAITDFETYLELDQDGQFAESANEYIESIQIELSALGG